MEKTEDRKVDQTKVLKRPKRNIRKLLSDIETDNWIKKKWFELDSALVANDKRAWKSQDPAVHLSTVPRLTLSAQLVSQTPLLGSVHFCFLAAPQGFHLCQIS